MWTNKRIELFQIIFFIDFLSILCNFVIKYLSSTIHFDVVCVKIVFFSGWLVQAALFMATSTNGAHHEIHVADDLTSASKQRVAVSKIVQSLKDNLSSVEEKLAGKVETSGRDSLEELDWTLQQLKGTLGDTANYLPAFEQRLLLERISAASRNLLEKRNEVTANQGFSFRRAPRVTKAPLEVKLDDRYLIDWLLANFFQWIVLDWSIDSLTNLPFSHSRCSDAPIISTKPISTITNGVPLSSGNTIQLDSCSNMERKFDRNALKNKDVLFSSLHHCKIFLEGSAATLNLKNLTNCTVVCGPISSAVFISDCKDCRIAVACQQLRIHNSDGLRCYVHLTSGGILENTTRCAFAPYNVVYPGLDCDFVEANLRRDANDNWQRIEDFDYVVSHKRSPNWTIIPEDERESFGDELLHGVWFFSSWFSYFRFHFIQKCHWICRFLVLLQKKTRCHRPRPFLRWNFWSPRFRPLKWFSDNVREKEETTNSFGTRRKKRKLHCVD